MDNDSNDLNDSIVLKKLKLFSKKEKQKLIVCAIELGYKEYEDRQILSEVLYEFFPEYCVPVCDVSFNDNLSILFVEELLKPTRIKNETCKYCGGCCENNKEHACDGYLGDIDNLYKDAEKEKD